MIINNVKLVLENEVVHGSLEVQDGEIRAFAESQSRQPEAMDGEGGWLLPGLIEVRNEGTLLRLNRMEMKIRIIISSESLDFRGRR